MAQLRVAVLGQLVVEVDGRPARLTPTNARMLIRLLLAGGRPVPIDQLYRDVWRAGAAAPVHRPNRTLVQRQIGELRRILDHERPGEASELLRTDRATTSAYRLAIPRGDVDIWEFEDLVEVAGRAEPEAVVELAPRALALWLDGPHGGFGSYPLAVREWHRYLQLRAGVQHGLLRAFVKLRRHRDAWTLAREMLGERPGDAEVRTLLDDLRRREATAQRVIFQHTFEQPRVTLVVTVGDLFSLHEADLVIGFTDTFDTSTRGDVVIAANSVQGQLLHRLYSGDRARLDRELRRALSGVAETGRETRASKPHGKLVRYPLGTVAMLSHGTRRLFCVAYSRLGNDLTARSTVELLKHGLDQVWDALHRHGQFADVAMPLIGSGRSRLDMVDHQGLLELILRSFIRASAQIPICRELRIVIAPAQTEKINIPLFRRVVDTL